MTRATTFTSYINVEPAKGVSQSFAKLEQQALSTFGRISAAAARANAQTLGLHGGSGLAGGGGAATTAMRAQANAQRELAQAQQRAVPAADRITRSVNQTGDAMGRAARETSRFERVLRGTATTLNVVQGPLGPVAGRVSALANAVSQLTGFSLGLAGVGAGLFVLGQQANRYAEIRSKLTPLYESQMDVNRAFNETIRIANEAKTALAPIVDLYSRLTLAGRDVGFTNQQTTALVDTAAKAAKLSGGNAASQEAGLYQFSQGIGSGNLGGDELRSVKEGTLRLAKALADGLGVPMSELKKLGKEGKLTPKVISEALAKEAPKIEAELARLPETLTSAATKFQNALMVMVGEADQSAGFTRALAEGVVLLADNLGLVTTALGTLAAAYAGLRATNYLAGIYNKIAAHQAEARAVRESARVNVEASEKAIRSSQSRITELRAEQRAIRSRIESERQLATETRRTALEANRNIARSGDYIFQNPREINGYATAVDKARVANNNFASSKSRLKQISVELGSQFNTLSTATNTYQKASAAAQGGAVAFGKSLLSLVGSLNLVGIAIGIGVSLLIQMAFSQEQAANTADVMSAAQNRLAANVDMTTGKIIQQNEALLLNARLQARDAKLQAQRDYRKAQDDTASFSTKENRPWYMNLTMGGPSFGGGGVPKSLQADIDLFRKGKIGPGELARRAERYRGHYGAGTDQEIDKIQQSAAQAATANDNYLYSAAEERILSGKGTKADYKLVGIGAGEANIPTKPSSASGGKGGVGGGSNRSNSKQEAADRKAEAAAAKLAAAEEKRLNDQRERTEKRGDILDRYDVDPKAIDKAYQDIRELDGMVGKTMTGLAEVTKKNPLGQGIYTQDMADADAARIEYGVREPIRQLVKDQERGLKLSELQLAGYDAEAAALEKALALQDDIGEVTRDEYNQILDNERAQIRVNDALASRQRILANIQGSVDTIRDSFEDMLISIQKGDYKSIKQFGKGLFDNFLKIDARKLTEQIFAGADENVRRLISGQNGVEVAIDILEDNSKRAGDGVGRLATAAENGADRIEKAFSKMDNVVNGSIGGNPSTTAEGQLPNGDLFTRGSRTTSSAAGQPSSLFKDFVTNAIGGSSSSVGGLIVVQGGDLPLPVPIDPGNTPNGRQTYNAIGEVIGDKLDNVFRQPGLFKDISDFFDKSLGSIFKTDGFFKDVGGAVGDAFQGAGTGVMASGFARALGIKQSTTGAAIGGAIGSAAGAATGIPGMERLGGVVGGLWGGTIGGALKKTKYGTSSLALSAGGDYLVAGASGGRGAEQMKAANGAAGSIATTLNNLADTLGATISGVPNISIGTYKDKWRVSTTGRTGKLKAKYSDVTDFGDDQEAAISFAVQQAISGAVITGISEASIRLLKAGDDLNTAIQKALLVESVPKRLMQRLDPVRYAVTELNREFERIISAMKEGGATAEQYQQAIQLYDLERADAIEAATNSTISALQEYLDEMNGGSSSPFNKRTVFDNAFEKLQEFATKLGAGQTVDSADLLTAARNFQEASRNLNGSSDSFFNDFDWIQSLLEQGISNAQAGASGDPLPGSPFAGDEAVQAALGQINTTTAAQTQAIASRLDTLIGLMQQGNYLGMTRAELTSTINNLPGFAS